MEGMKSDVQDFIMSCNICKKAKPDRAKYLGFLPYCQCPLNPSNWFLWILLRGSHALGMQIVCLKRWIKSLISAIPYLSLPFHCTSVSPTLPRSCVLIHGMPSHIVLDRDRILTSAFYRALFILANTTLCMSSAYHPHTDE